MQTDALLSYCQALDRGDMNTIGAIMDDICKQGNKELSIAIFGLHARFDSYESFTAQLMAVRQQYEGGIQ